MPPDQSPFESLRYLSSSVQWGAFLLGLVALTHLPAGVAAHTIGLVVSTNQQAAQQRGRFQTCGTLTLQHRRGREELPGLKQRTGSRMEVGMGERRWWPFLPGSQGTPKASGSKSQPQRMHSPSSGKVQGVPLPWAEEWSTQTSEDYRTRIRRTLTERTYRPSGGESTRLYLESIFILRTHQQWSAFGE